MSLETEQLLLLAVGMSKVAETEQFVQTSCWTLIPAAKRHGELTPQKLGGGRGKDVEQPCSLPGLRMQ